MKRSRFPLLISVGVMLFFYLPIFLLVVGSFNDSRYGGPWRGFTLKWYERLLTERDIWAATENTLIIALVSTVVATCLGTIAAWVLHRYHGALQRTHYLFMYMPLVVPDILMGISLLLLFVNFSAKLGLTTITLAHITFCTSYVTLVVLGRLQDFDNNVVDAALDLGARWPRIIWNVILPMLGPGIASGALLAFTLSVDDFIITFFVCGPGSTTLPLYVYSSMKHGSPTIINALCTIFMAVTAIIVITGQFLMNRRQPVQQLRS
ncbi:MAG: ABC transporter permease [Opitutales bacterium]|nr:ABC transporter permease [Opitutales bacterium]